MFFKELKDRILDQGAAACAAVSLKPLLAYMSDENQKKLFLRMPNAKSVVCALFSYNTEDSSDANICRYARGKDYHAVISRLLHSALEGMSGADFLVLVDNSPLPEVIAAALCGLGNIGGNGLLLNKEYGSRVFIGTILTSGEYCGGVCEISPCDRCGKCVAKCPTHALYYNGGKATFDAAKCLSFITQKKGELLDTEAAAIAHGRFIWGCDCCTDACPYNYAAPKTQIEDFRDGLLCSISASDIVGLTNREFNNKYGDRAFAWRGAEVLRRNLKIIK